MPLPLVAHLVHVDVDSGHILIAPLDPRVLEDADGQKMDSNAELFSIKFAYDYELPSCFVLLFYLN